MPGEAKRDVQQCHHRLLVQWITDHAAQVTTGEQIYALLTA